MYNVIPAGDLKSTTDNSTRSTPSPTITPMTSIDYNEDGFRYHSFDPKSKTQFDAVSNLIADHLSEPYSIYVYWYFFSQWPQYCFLLSPENSDDIIGVIITKVEPHREVRIRGYIGMLVIDPKYRGKGLAKKLVKLSMAKMTSWGQADEIMLETEVSNTAALNLYELLGFMRTKRLYRYYLNTQDAFRLIFPILEKLLMRLAYLPPLETSEVQDNL